MASTAPVLTLAELEGFDPHAPPRAGRRRFACPLPACAGKRVDPDHRSLSVESETGLWHCHRCSAGGQLREFWTERDPTARPRLDPRARARQARARISLTPPPSSPAPCEPCRSDLAELLAGYQRALSGSPGEAYLAGRGIPLDLAQRHGIGYAAEAAWIGRPAGARVVIPHTRPDGAVVNLYGRAIGDAPRGLAHDHLPGRRGLFNAAALADSSAEPVHVTEAPLDALALMAAGYPSAISLFGTRGPLEWWRPGSAVVLALDADAAGQSASAELLAAAGRRGVRVGTLPTSAYAGHKDASEAWTAGALAAPALVPRVILPEPRDIPTPTDTLSDRVGPRSGTFPDTEPAIADPMPDLTEDAPLWRRLLTAAAAMGDDLYGALNGARCAGALLIEDGRGLRLQARPGAEADYAEVRVHLAPHSAAVTALLRASWPTSWMTDPMADLMASPTD